jgi:hypothetical protein
MITFDVLNRFTGAVQFTAKIDCTADTLPSIKLGLAVKWAIEKKVNLRGSDLSGSDLSGANLSGSDLSGSDLSGSDLNGSDLSGSDMRWSDLSWSDLSGSDMRGSDLRWSNLSGSDMRGSDLSWSNLNGSDMRGAKNLTDMQLRSIIADYWMILSMARAEVPALIAALRNGAVDGTAYSGDCACLVGTLENSGAKNLPRVSTSPAECWFMEINEGDKPGDDSAGGFASAKAMAWAEQYCALTGIELVTP